MHDAFRLASAELASFLSRHLPKLSEAWWQKRVIERLSFQQQRTATEKSIQSLGRLDFAALLRVADQNWTDIANELSLPRDARNWLKELQAVRNRWAHSTAEEAAPSEVYRDADTLERLLLVIGASKEALSAVREAKEAAFRQMAERTVERRMPGPVGDPRNDDAAGQTRRRLLDAGEDPAMPSAPRQADRIRYFVMTQYVEAARRAGATSFTIRAGDVHKAMGLANALPAVCSAIGSRKFSEMAGACAVERAGPANSTTTSWKFEFDRDGPQ